MNIQNKLQSMGKRTEQIDLLELTDLFCKNQQSFYLEIAKYAASSDDKNEEDVKPLRLHRIENMIDCILSPNRLWSFYNAILDTDICSTMEQYSCNNHDKIIKQILSLISHYKCPTRVQVKPTAIATQKLLEDYGFFQLPMSDDAFQYIDFYDEKNFFQSMHVDSNMKIYELDDSTQADCQTRKSEWSDVLCQSFGFRNPEIYEPFYSDVWSRVQVGPTKSIRMFIAIKDDRVIGGCHLSLACGVASLFNVTKVKSERGKGIGKALSLTAMIVAKELEYRYMVLQASQMGSTVYKKLGFKSLPSYRIFVKIATVAWYYKIIEILLIKVGFQRLQRLISIIEKPGRTLLTTTVVFLMVTGVFLAMMFRL